MRVSIMPVNKLNKNKHQEQICIYFHNNKMRLCRVLDGFDDDDREKRGHPFFSAKPKSSPRNENIRIPRQDAKCLR